MGNNADKGKFSFIQMVESFESNIGSMLIIRVNGSRHFVFIDKNSWKKMEVDIK